MNETFSKSSYALESFSLRGLYLELRGPCQPPPTTGLPLGKKTKISFTLTNKASERAVTLFSPLNLMMPPQLKARPTEKVRNQ